jgi:type VI secretion system protein VasD
MSRTVGNSLILATLAVLLAGCGVTQTVTEGTASATRSIFYKQVKDLHLDFSARTAINTDAADMNAMSVATLVRVYQLSDSKALQRATYDSLLGGDEQVLAGELLDTRALVIKPGEGARLDVPLDKDARFVTVVALFRNPDVQMNTWRLTLSRDDLDPDRARVIELGDNQLALRELARE